MNITEFLKAWADTAKNIEAQKKVAQDIWYDWFCKDESLYNRTKKFIPCLKQLVKLLPNVGQMEVSGKNCCPCNGSLYDCMRIFNDDDFVGAISFDCCYADDRFQLLTHDDKEPCFNNRIDAVNALAESIANL